MLSSNCGGSTQTGLCPGPNDVTCCKKSSDTSCTGCINGGGGAGCADRSSCKMMGSTCTTCLQYGGGKGCLPKCDGSGSTPLPPNPPGPSYPSSGSFLPAKPDTSGNYGSCTTPYNKYQGTCISRDKCTGGTYNGLCPGSSNVVCCVPETTATSAVPAGTKLTFDNFYNLFEGISRTRAQALYPYFVSSMQKANINTCLEISAYVAQLSHESSGLRYFEEIASGSAYEGRTDLGNTQPGDGRRYKGRGPIQLTGRSNYRNAGNKLGLPLESKPELVCMPSAGFLAVVYYWTMTWRGDLSDYGRTGTYNDFVALTRAVNGGTNGLQDRLNRWYKARSYMGCSANAQQQQQAMNLAVTATTTGDAESSEMAEAGNLLSSLGTPAISVGVALVVVGILAVAVVFAKRTARTRSSRAMCEADAPPANNII